MKGEFAQMISLASYGNEFFRSGRLMKDYFPKNIAFRSCNKVDFKEDKKHFFYWKPREVLIAENPSGWFERLKLNGCKNLRLYYQPSEEYGPASDHQLAGFLGGGGMLSLEAVYEGYSDYWTSQWSMPETKEQEQRFWTVEYKLAFKKQPTANKEFNVDQTYSLLDKALSDIIDFANQQRSGWTETFAAARSVLKEDMPGQDSHYKVILVEENYSLSARQVFFASVKAWVFGGMGSWNDLYFNDGKDKIRYEEVSAKLYAAINQSCLATINSF